MPQVKVSRRRFTPGESQYALERLIATKRVTLTEVSALVAGMHREIIELEQRLAALRRVAGTLGSGAAADLTGRSAGGEQSKARMTPELAESRRIQGEYMGLLRHVKGRARDRMKKIASDQGRQAAIAAMRGLATK